jgi:trimethylamine---corrinoid protein Co-methyltransferase
MPPGDLDSSVKTPRPASRRAGHSRRDGATLYQLPWRQLRNPYRPFELASADEVDAIHGASLEILERIGIRFSLPAAREIFRKAGALVDDDTMRVRIGSDIVAQALKTVPDTVTLESYNPERTVTLGRDKLVFATVLGPPYCHDMERGRRQGTLADYGDFIKLAQVFNIIHLIGGSPVEPGDIAVPVRHLDAIEVMLNLSDKIPYVFCQSQKRILDAFEMIAIARSITMDELARKPSTYSIINTNSPLQYDLPMTEGVIEMARFGQPTLITPFTLAGATTPITLAGAIAQQNAEILAGVTLSQLVRPGAPILYGGATSNVDMRTGSPGYGSPESVRATFISGQLARKYGLPMRSSNFSGSTSADYQAAVESQLAACAAISAGANLLMHAAGWMEGGLCASFEKFVLDVEMLQMMAVWLEPVRIDKETLALDVIEEVGPGGHFFGTAQTIEKYETAFYRPLIFNTRSHGQWVEDGKLDATARAHQVYLQALKEYHPPALDPARREAIHEFAERRKAEGGAPLT